ncbi:hypothetical protein [Pseudomonas sp. R45(2017)]|uniref:hypothetical protein n=1 Tax=Pseudomonas sp. R45(2017) TaxID=1981678 RepID=UPI000A1FE037|nr:hypothetical protein [Pseudomonas sp. R45(2017)]
MDIVTGAEYCSITAGAVSAFCWVMAAVVTVDPPEKLKGMPDGEYIAGTVYNGGDLVRTLSAQGRWNSIAAIAAATAMAFQIATKLALLQ